MAINLNIKQWNLRQKIILHVFVIVLIATSFLAYIYLSTLNNLFNLMNAQRSEMVSSMIECNLTYLMSQGQNKVIQTALNRISALSNMKKVRILDQNGRIMHSSQENEKGQMISGQKIRILKDIYPDLTQAKVFSDKIASTNISFLPIKNKPECFSCHSPEKKLNGILEIQIDDSQAVGLLRKNQAKGLVIAFLSLVVLIFIILRLFEKIINRPISKLKQQMKEVRSGNLNVTLQPTKKDEIGDLTHSFNIMVEDLKQANERIETLYNQRIEKAEHLASLGELAAGLAHDIKNPIAGIKGALEIIKEQTEPDDPKREIYIEIIHQTDKIYNIIQDLLNYARPRQLDMNMDHPAKPIHAAIKMAASQTQDKDIKIICDRTEENIQVLMDESKIQEVILNMLLNSIASIEKKGIIKISTKADIRNNRFEIIINDTGKGIKPENIPLVFNPFFTTRRKGTGLGLSICKKIIQEHGGIITVHSQEGRGTEFIIQIPLKEINSSE